MHQFTFIDLFSGIGGFHIALSNQGGKCVFACEIDKNTRATYTHNFQEKNPTLFQSGNFPQDITQVEGSEVPDHDILCAGFPCQAFSIAGYRKGFEDNRGNLFFDIARIIKIKNPSVVFLENVKNLKNHDNGNTFQIIQDTLKGLGYHVKFEVLNTYEYGNIPQNRERIYIVAFKNKAFYNNFQFPEKIPLTYSLSELLQNEVAPEYYYNDKPLYKRIKDDVIDTDVAYQWRRQYVRENKKGLVPTLTANMGTGGHNVPIIKDQKGIRKLTPQECLRFQGYPTTYSFPDISKGQKYKQAGNSVSVPVIQRIGQKIISAMTTPTMLYKNYSKSQRDTYKELLCLVGSLSNLSADSATPYLNYRSAENIYCNAFNAQNLSRSDVSVDAVQGKTGIGIKTFLIGNKKTFQKVAEFNASREQYIHLDPLEKIKKIAELRNDRIDFTKNTYSLDTLIYHCIVRSKGKFYIYECGFEKIDISKIKLGKVTKTALHFSDSINEYSFNLSKSTLLKRFNTPLFEDEQQVNIIENILEELKEFSDSRSQKNTSFGEETIFLPLYSPSGKSFESSGLNQWNAAGRKRDEDEVYIPIPSWIHKQFSDFFPKKGQAFDLKLPDGESISVKVCQSGSKALMSNPNNALGKWLLRDVLSLKKGQLVTLELLEKIGIDTVGITKSNSGAYEIHFKEFERYKQFELNNKN